MNWKKFVIISGIIIFVLLIIALFILVKKTPEVDKNLIKCIVNRTIIYTQTNSLASATQTLMFGEFRDKLHNVDCSLDNNTQNCVDINITGTPTWFISNQTDVLGKRLYHKYEGILEMNELKNLTNC